MISKLLTGFSLFLVFAFVLVLVLLLYKASVSKKTALYSNNLSMGLMTLKPCSKKPNCVCSEYKDDEGHYIEPLHYQLDDADMLQKMTDAIIDMKGDIIEKNSTYLAAEFRSKWFGFVDDVELRLDSENKQLHFRSASREGHSDFDQNRLRINQLKEYFL